ncbi:Aspartate aminotransferase 1 [Gracilariopsis chorda]|uniref:Aspartate aminotransferase n=2 Tax=Gracilariopsis TaxID=2781 RepID=A0A2V3J4U8_9FLOR|nr:aspartate aminotransferase [Gracilariopsis lemaneiformis]PXF48400.1 Aspartate aminotransferase 1 [Gracilariopsis chorda]|eukprot:PXF48400.1 Aspartate aminotransferase 1 [Gracilariopsis chorda]
MPHSLFSAVPAAPPDPILSITAAFRADPSPKKVNLGVGAYRTDDGLPYVLPIVRQYERHFANDHSLNHEYLPQDGLTHFTVHSARLMFGKHSAPLNDNRVVTVQALSGTGALRIGFAFIATFLGQRLVYVPNPTWSNHRNVVPHAGLPPTRTYRYFDAATCAVDIDGLLADLKAAVPGSIVIFHGCAHNPTGADPSREQWKQILQVVKEAALVPFFDNAYQGFASGDLDTDAWSTRLFADSGIEMFVAQSYAKNMGMYGERVGALNVVLSSSSSVDIVRGQLKRLIRATYSSPPLHGARIAAAIMSDEHAFRSWQTELRTMSERIRNMRTRLRDCLVANGAPGNWDHIVKQIGMFSFTGLNAEQVRFIRSKYHVYMTLNGRISMAGLTEATVQYVADAICDAVKSIGRDA